ncbi:hypothetical protein HMPREF9997_02221 [Corynebacterium durum F0235]|uniref:Uncharacterized protein n=1 Tax=Corynebacterium durum F0235 TaxID=1035195 RepID=L1MBE9_9CORY|nr:hypothetical protein HMPREF9997_02221 [Corynebacterium durum F0235]
MNTRTTTVVRLERPFALCHGKHSSDFGQVIALHNKAAHPKLDDCKPHTVHP